MKKYFLSFLILLSAAIVLTTGCKKDSETEPTINSDIAGVWNCTAIDYTGTTVTEVSGQSLTTEFTGEGYDIDFTLTFVENPNEVTSEGSYSIKLTTTLLGQSTVQYIETQPFEYTGTWSMDNNTISITNDGDTDVATITELTDNTLVITITDEEVVSNMGITGTTTTNLVASFSR
jgi:hypothetical protein